MMLMIMRRRRRMTRMGMFDQLYVIHHSILTSISKIYTSTSKHVFDMIYITRAEFAVASQHQHRHNNYK
jgi:hypothetical protein